MSIWKKRGYLFTGDLIYKGTLYAFFESTDPRGYYNSITNLSKLENVSEIYPGHNKIGLNGDFIEKIKLAFNNLKEANLLSHGSGIHEFEEFSIKL